MTFGAPSRRADDRQAVRGGRPQADARAAKAGRPGVRHRLASGVQQIVHAGDGRALVEPGFFDCRADQHGAIVPRHEVAAAAPGHASQRRAHPRELQQLPAHRTDRHPRRARHRSRFRPTSSRRRPRPRRRAAIRDPFRRRFRRGCCVMRRTRRCSISCAPRVWPRRRWRGSGRSRPRIHACRSPGHRWRRRPQMRLLGADGRGVEQSYADTPRFARASARRRACSISASFIATSTSRCGDTESSMPLSAETRAMKSS